MNKALLLLLVTLVQCQSDGVFLSPQSDSDKFNENIDDFQLEDWENSDPYSMDPIKNYDQKVQLLTKRSGSDVLTRRSALDKNFMRFGRNSGGSFSQKNNRRTGLTKTNFFRFGRGYKDSFIRFGRGAQDNFIRFGRGGKDNFIRFGRGGTDDFFRAGKSGRENFIRFGKADKNFMRFGRDGIEDDNGRESLDNQDYFSHLRDTTGKYNEIPQGFERTGKSPGKQDNFIRFGKSGNQKEGRNGTNFLRFGKKDDSETSDLETDDSDFDVNDHDLNGDSLKYGPIMRIKRRTKETDNISQSSGNKEIKKKKVTEKLKSDSKNNPVSIEKKEDIETGNLDMNKPNSGKPFEKRSIGFFEEGPDNFPRRLYPVFVNNPWENLKNLRNSRLTPFFPVSSKIPSYVSNPNFFVLDQNLESKRDKGGSNFIRFG